MSERRRITVDGIVQGVGFRPFVYGLAIKNALVGFVLNDASGVTIELEGDPPALDNFLMALHDRPPPLSRINRVACRSIPPTGDSTFSILGSLSESQRHAWVVPDTPTCDDCLRELFDPADRRYRYPFINCTHCGPRFTIIRDIPYDRERTTMAAFRMCADCNREFHDSVDRRFHAQPNACPRCGPRARLLDANGGEMPDDDPITQAARLLRQGALLAVKGLGGYHLACNALDPDAVQRLRFRKHREEKPLALMARDLDAARELCWVSEEDESRLCSTRRPIVLLRLRENEKMSVAGGVAPGQHYLGLMLPYTPLHHLLLADVGFPLVMTSGNLSEEPIAYKDDEALRRLGGIADCFLVHDRQIHMRCDDSVVRGFDHQELIIRRSRGYAPQPITTRFSFVRPILAAGGHLKNTFCLGKGRQAFLSHHIGDLENYETLESFVQAIEHFKNLFSVEPAAIAHDLHPDYLSTRYAVQSKGLARIGVQHHHAHIAGCMAEHGLEGPVIGVAFDGLGYGADGTIWGGEFLIAGLSGFERRAHLRPVPMAGGNSAIRQPWRMALSYLRDALGSDPRSLGLPGWCTVARRDIEIVTAMMQRGLNTVATSSVGRLFDAVASLLGLRHTVSYEGQAAVELEMLAAEHVEESYPFAVDTTVPWQIDMRPTVERLVQEIRMSASAGVIAAKFHNTLVTLMVDVCRRLRETDGLSRVCLGGGVFQNMYLLQRAHAALCAGGFEVYLNRKVPPNDGGISFGQAAVANATLQRGDRSVLGNSG